MCDDKPLHSSLAFIVNKFEKTVYRNNKIGKKIDIIDTIFTLEEDFMYQIAICEDEKLFAESLEKNCQRLCNKLNIHTEITVCQRSVHFLNLFLTKPQHFDLLLLDIVMDEVNGIELAKKIRAQNKKVTIIFVTSHTDFALQGYEVQAFHYLLKPVQYDLLEKLIYDDYQYRFQKESIVLASHLGTIRLQISDVVALETVNRKVAVYLLDQTLFYAGKLGDLVVKFPPELFIRCHQSFVVNIKNVRELNRTRIITVNKKLIPVSRSYQKVMQQAFLTQLEN